MHNLPAHSIVYIKVAVVYIHAKQKHPGCKKVRGQQEVALPMCDQKL